MRAAHRSVAFCVAVCIGCTSGRDLISLGEGDPDAAAPRDVAVDATSSVPVVVDAGPACAASDVASDDCCVPDDVVCLTGGYAHFAIANVAGSGLPRAATYDVSDELVREEITGLVWERYGRAEAMGWPEAKAFCRELTLGGRDDFRLPTRIELVTILDFDELPVIADVFEGFESDYHWTSSVASFAQGSAYSVYFGAGETTVANASPGRARVLCVAGEIRVVDGPQFDVTEDDAALDRATRLAWERESAPPLSHDEASARCASLDMRLPSIRELQSIVDEARYQPAIDEEVFGDTLPQGYWSSTLRGGDPWYVDFTEGKTYADRFASEALPSRCVR